MALGVTNHNSDVSNRTVTDLVAARVPFFDITSTVELNTISSYIWEACNEVEKCFKVSWVKDITTQIVTIDTTRIADEQYYSALQKSILGDIASMYYIQKKIVELSGKIGVNGSSDTTLGAQIGKLITTAKAGETEVDFAELNTKNVPLLLQAPDLLMLIKQEIARKMLTFGCIFDLNDSVLVNAALKRGYSVFGNMPFQVIRDYEPCLGCGA